MRDDLLLNVEPANNDASEDELGIIECLEDYLRILTNVARNVSGTSGARKRQAALARALQVNQLIDRLKALESEETH